MAKEKFVVISKFEKNGVIEKIEPEKRISSENEPYVVAHLVLSEENFFSAEKNIYKINLGPIENKQMKDMEKVNRVLTQLKEQGLDVSPINDANTQTLANAVNPIIGKPVKFWDVQARKTKNGETEEFSYITLKEPRDSSQGSVFANAHSADLQTMHPELKIGDCVTVKLNSIVFDSFQSFDNGKPVNNYDTRTDSRQKLYQLLMELFQRDGGQSAQSIIKRLEEAKSTYGDRLTYLEILQCVGSFSKKSALFTQGDLNENTKRDLATLVSKNDYHANYAALKYTFTFYGDEGKTLERDGNVFEPIFKTTITTQPKNKYQSPNPMGALFCPNDCTIADFSQLTNTIQSLLTREQVKELASKIMAETNPADILSAITQTIKDAGYDLKIEIIENTTNHNKMARAIGFAKHENGSETQQPFNEATSQQETEPMFDEPTPQQSNTSYVDELDEAESNVAQALGTDSTESDSTMFDGTLEIDDEDLPF